MKYSVFAARSHTSAVAGALGGDLPRGVRMAPACPLFREPVQCSRCEAWVASPSVSAQGWLDHFGFAVQSAAGGVCACLHAVQPSEWHVDGLYMVMEEQKKSTADTAGYRGIPWDTVLG